MFAFTRLRSWCAQIAAKQNSSLIQVFKQRRRRSHLQFERLEDRSLLAGLTFTVISAADAGTGTFREAIALANAAPGLDAIEFNIPGSGVQSIQVGSMSGGAELPAVTSPLTINGYTQPGASANSHASASNAVLNIELDGSQMTTGALTGGLKLDAGSGGSTVRGLVINRFPVGIYVGSENNVVAGNFIGTNANGSAALANRTAGVRVEAANNFVGGTACADRNVISGNSDQGVLIEVDNGGQVIGNLIGTDRTGSFAIPNQVGVQSRGLFCTIGGLTAGHRNVISGNVDDANIPGTLGNGVMVPSNCMVQGNYIGTDATGMYAIGNTTGILATRGSLIGGTDPGARNVVSGNEIGIKAGGNDIVQGNLIGTDVTGNARLSGAAQSFGVQLLVLTGQSAVLVGGSTPQARNVISGNSKFGIWIQSNENVIQGNYIG